MKRRMLAFILAVSMVMLCMPSFTLSARADDVVVYDAKDLESRTLEEVAARYSAVQYLSETYDDRDDLTYYIEPASFESPYAYGVLTDDTLLSMRAMVNYYRWLIGSDEWEDIVYHSDESLQAQAFDRNFEFSHYIHETSKPDDMDLSIWGPGYNMDHNILAIGYSPRGSVIGWINEGYSTYSEQWGTLGHRNILLNPTMADVKFGYSGDVGIGKIVKENGFTYNGQLIDYSGPFLDKAFIAYPAPGYMPAELVYPSQAAWSVQINSGKVEVDTDSVNVTIVKESTGEVFTRTKNDYTLSAGLTSIAFVQPPVSDGQYSGKYEGKYSVRITGLKDKQTGKDAEICYTVNFVNIRDYAPTFITETAKDIGKFWIYETMADKLDVVAAIAPKEVMIETDLDSTAMIPVSGQWSIQKETEWKGTFVNCASEKDLPGNLTDKNGELKNINILYEITDDDYYSDNSFVIETESGESPVPVGAEVKFVMGVKSDRFVRAQIFKINTDSPGNYSSEVVFDSRTDDYTWNDGRTEITFVKKVVPKDSGDYITVYYEGHENYYMAAEVSTSMQTLIVAPCNHAETSDSVIEPSDSTQGYTTHICSICGETYRDSFVPALSGGIVLKNSSRYTEKGDNVIADTWNTAWDELLGNFEEQEHLQIFDLKGNAVSSGIAGTGYEVRLVRNGKTADTRILVVTGDASGDGLIDVVDVKLALNVSLNKQQLSGAFNVASNVNNDDIIDVVDVKLILNVSLGKQQTFAVS